MMNDISEIEQKLVDDLRDIDRPAFKKENQKLATQIIENESIWRGDDSKLSQKFRNMTIDFFDSVMFQNIINSEFEYGFLQWRPELNAPTIYSLMIRLVKQIHPNLYELEINNSFKEEFTHMILSKYIGNNLFVIVDEMLNRIKDKKIDNSKYTYIVESNYEQLMSAELPVIYETVRTKMEGLLINVNPKLNVSAINKAIKLIHSRFSPLLEDYKRQTTHYVPSMTEIIILAQVIHEHKSSLEKEIFDSLNSQVIKEVLEFQGYEFKLLTEYDQIFGIKETIRDLRIIPTASWNKYAGIAFNLLKLDEAPQIAEFDSIFEKAMDKGLAQQIIYYSDEWTVETVITMEEMEENIKSWYKENPK